MIRSSWTNDSTYRMKNKQTADINCLPALVLSHLCTLVIPNGHTIMKMTQRKWKTSPTPAKIGKKSDDTRHFRPNIRTAGMLSDAGSTCRPWTATSSGSSPGGSKDPPWSRPCDDTTGPPRYWPRRQGCRDSTCFTPSSDDFMAELLNLHAWWWGCGTCLTPQHSKVH